MATDPNTGQSVIPQTFEQKYAAFLDPQGLGQLQSDESRQGQMSQLGQAMMQQGYIPNSGFGGALNQIAHSLLGMYMVKQAQDQAGQLYSRRAELEAQAAQAARKAARDDESFKTNESLRLETGKLTAAEKIKLENADQEAQNEAKAAGLKSAAELPSELQKVAAQGRNTLAAAEISANATKGRAYQIQDANGNTSMVALQPDGSFKQVYQTTTPGGGKLTPSQSALNTADTNNLEKLGQREAAAKQLQTNLVNWTANYTGANPQELQTLTPQQLADKVKSVGALSAIGTMNPIGNRGLDAIANDIAINAAGTKQPTPTEEVLKAERNNTVSRYKTPAENAQIILNHAKDIEELQKQREALIKGVNARQPPGAGRIPGATNGPQNPAQPPSGVTHVWTPQGGLQPIGDLSQGIQN